MPIDSLKFSYAIRKEAEKLWETLEVYARGDDTKLLEKEKEHQEIIKEYSANSVLIDNIFTPLKCDDENIQQEAFLVAIESKNSELINKVIKWMGSKFTFVAMLYYLSDEAIQVFYSELGKSWQKLDNIPSQQMIGAFVIAHRKLQECLPLFVDLNRFDVDAQKKILQDLCIFPKFKEVFIENYNNKKPEFIRTIFMDENPADSAVLLLLAKEEDRALSLLRNKEHIINKYGFASYLNKYGNQSDGQIVLDALKTLGNNDDTYSSFEYTYSLMKHIQGLKEGGGNYIYVNFLINKIKLKHPELLNEICEQLAKYFFIDEDDDEELYEEYDEILFALNEFNCADDISELSKDEQEKVDPDYIIAFWRRTYEKNKSKIDDTKRIDLYDGGLFSLQNMLQELLYYGPRRGSVGPSYLNDLFIYTGKYLPLNIGGYYTQAKKDINAWEDYIEENKKDLEPGKWWRYGRSAD